MSGALQTTANTNMHAPNAIAAAQCTVHALHRSQPQPIEENSHTTNLPTPIKTPALHKWLSGYPHKQKIVEMFTSGVYLDFEGNDAPLTSNNSQSALLQPDVVQTKLLHELSNDRIAGPFHTPPFINFKSSPLALREKQQHGTYRLLHNLSYPYDLNSVNYNIPKSASTVTYENLSHAVTAIQDSSPNAHMAKSDIADAFRLIPLHPSQYHLTGFNWGNKYYDK